MVAMQILKKSITVETPLPRAAIVVDIDGCICETEFILKEAEQLGLKGSEYWNYFNKNIARYKANSWCVELIKKYLKTHWVILFTARAEETTDDTVNMLVALFPEILKQRVQTLNLQMRKTGDFRKAHEVKESMLQELLNLETVKSGDLRIEFALDDDAENCTMFKKYGIPTLQVK